jgi:Plasmid pRiA4b ORF-3-like protein
VANANRSKQVRKPASVTLRIELCDIEPLIWRRIVVPASWPMSTLHNYVQWVMGWQDTHAHEFRIGDQIIAPDWWIKEISLDRDTGNDRDERRVKVATVVSESAATGEFEYAYDMGDGWRHRLVVETDIGAPARKFDRLPLCTAGENACLPAGRRRRPAWLRAVSGCLGGPRGRGSCNHADLDRRRIRSAGI